MYESSKVYTLKRTCVGYVTCDSSCEIVASCLEQGLY